MIKNVPFNLEDCCFISFGSVVSLAEWLEKNCLDKSVIIGGDYTVDMLIADLNIIADNIWNDGIDAMGDDA